ncbi:hypothetical protein IWX50DRAFT_640758 [Phyllosticta citricarpa]
MRRGCCCCCATATGRPGQTIPGLLYAEELDAATTTTTTTTTTAKQENMETPSAAASETPHGHNCSYGFQVHRPPLTTTPSRSVGTSLPPLCSHIKQGTARLGLPLAFSLVNVSRTRRPLRYDHVRSTSSFRITNSTFPYVHCSITRSAKSPRQIHKVNGCCELPGARDASCRQRCVHRTYISILMQRND